MRHLASLSILVLATSQVAYAATHPSFYDARGLKNRSLATLAEPSINPGFSPVVIGAPAVVTAAQHHGLVNTGTSASSIATNADAAFNTISTVSAGVGAPNARSVAIVGTLTATVGGGDYGVENGIIPSGGTLNTDQGGFVIGTTNGTFVTNAVNLRLYAPGGIAPTFNAEAANSFTDLPGAGLANADSTSTLTYTFDDTYSGANSVEFSGNLTGAPTFRRLNTATTLGSATTANAVKYRVQQFTVDTTGTYVIGGSADFDSFFNLFAGSFTPGTTTGGLAVADESALVLLSNGFDVPIAAEGTGNTALISQSLTAGTQYFLVTTTFLNSTDIQGGDFLNFITGPGAITLVVPEPTTLAALSLGGLLARRRRA